MTGQQRLPTAANHWPHALTAVLMLLSTAFNASAALPDGQSAAQEQSRLPTTATTTTLQAKSAVASAILAAQRDIPAASVLAPAANGEQRMSSSVAQTDSADGSDGSELTTATRGARLPDDIDHGVALDGRGNPVRSRKAVFVRYAVAAKGELLRSIAYRYSTSPRALAYLNDIRWDQEGTELVEGEKLSVPVRYRSASGFAEAKRLETGPGVRVDRPHSSWGRPYVIALLGATFQATHRLWPGRHPLIIHDISRFGGGRIGGHKSHRAGRDIDIGYPTREPERLGWGVPGLDTIDYERLWFIIDNIERSGYTAAIYMSPAIQRRLHAYAEGQGVPAERRALLFQYPAAKGQKTTLIRHSKGHRDHFHVRFCSPAEFEELSS